MPPDNCVCGHSIDVHKSIWDKWDYPYKAECLKCDCEKFERKTISKDVEEFLKDPSNFENLESLQGDDY